ncbi:MAG: ParA family protein [Thiothrix sp.]|uniref:ParA family protein n=1 Tax=Thiothrix sp. TaxID=1032 RepID=UPI00263A2445|nr:ParA family protein [Thiothrix sp.]MDD5394748.1 ParA family protein [Thiothrix sp.]
MSADFEKKPTIITICSTKGGVGKTTLTANIGGYLASLDKRVLLVDADVQPALSSYYELTKDTGHGLVRLLTAGDLVNTINTTSAGCDLIYSDDPEGQLQGWLLKTADSWRYISYRLNKLKPSYDFILIDTQGAIGPLQDAAIFAADMLLSPIPTETMSAREFSRGLVSMLMRLRTSFCNAGLPTPPLYGVLYRVDRTRDAANVVKEMRGAMTGELAAVIQQDDGCPNLDITIMDAMISSSVAWREAATLQVPIHTLTKYPVAKQTLMAVIAELGILPDLNVEEGKA